MNDDLDLLLVDLEAVRQKQLIDGAIGAIFQLELIAKMALTIAIVQPSKNDILPLLEILSKRMLPLAIADYQLHGVEVAMADLENWRERVMPMVKASLELKTLLESKGLSDLLNEV
jgi:hypothetical protein